MKPEPTFDREGFAALTAIFRDHRENFKDLDFDGDDIEVMGVNPNAFSVTTTYDDFTYNTSVTAKMLSELFEASPSAKVLRIKISPIKPPGNEDWSIDKVGGTITIIGTL